MKNKILFKFFLAGLIITAISVLLFFQRSSVWYFFGGLGLWFVFDYLASLNTKKTALQTFLRDKKKFLKLYFGMLLFGAAIEFIGRFIFGLWEYPLYNKFHEIASVFFYPFLLFQLREMYILVKSKIKISLISLGISVILGVVIWEIPNLFSNNWIYYIPVIDLEILEINIIVILGWTLLILIPDYVYKIILKEK